MKLKELSKSIIIGILVPLLFFSALELTQRVRWYFKSGRDTYWLLYGFAGRPANFDSQIAALSAKLTAKKTRTNINDIQIFTKVFPGGYKKQKQSVGVPNHPMFLFG